MTFRFIFILCFGSKYFDFACQSVPPRGDIEQSHLIRFRNYNGHLHLNPCTTKPSPALFKNMMRTEYHITGDIKVTRNPLTV